MRIGELSERSGVSVRLLRYYEEQGLLRPRRESSGYRVYAEDDVETVRRIRLLLAAGLSTATILEVLPCLVLDGDRLVPACADLVARLRGERARIDAMVGDLLTSRSLLDAVIGAGVAGAGGAGGAGGAAGAAGDAGDGSAMTGGPALAAADAPAFNAAGSIPSMVG